MPQTPYVRSDNSRSSAQGFCGDQPEGFTARWNRNNIGGSVQVGQFGTANGWAELNSVLNSGQTDQFLHLLQRSWGTARTTGDKQARYVAAPRPQSRKGFHENVRAF